MAPSTFKLNTGQDMPAKREDIFVVTKLWNTYSTRAEVGLDKSLKALQLDYVDLHWPVGMNPNGKDDRFPKLPDGSRDMLLPYLEQLLKKAEVVPAVNQIESHPPLPQQEVVDFCKQKGIHVMAYSPLGSTWGPLMKSEPVVQVAE
ncbi:NADP-dependent oxidoreductase domain-containing protein [Xylariaceae sp. AK1471]|nr:NADP-dependent oxidoreductase domain-containing protein [Xylariaceae sp. AK1471]